MHIFRDYEYVLSALDEYYAEVVRGMGAEIHPVPASWDESRFTPPRPFEPESEGDPESADLGVSVQAAVDTPPSGVPAASCSSTPAPNTFCPYSTTTSNTRPLINCTQSLVGQLTQAANVTYANGTVVIGGQVRPYFQFVNLGTTAGPAPQIVWGVRIGRQPSAAVPVVRETVVVAGQHGNEWETTEMVRRLIFYYAEQYRIGNATIRSYLDQQAILFVPALNAEGYQYTHDVLRTWRGSRQTCSTGGWVDTNRNFQFGFGSDNEGSSPTCGASNHRGSAWGVVQETHISRAMVASPGYRALSLINLHAAAGTIGLPGGFSTGTIGSTSVCTDLRNVPVHGFSMREGADLPRSEASIVSRRNVST